MGNIVASYTLCKTCIVSTCIVNNKQGNRNHNKVIKVIKCDGKSINFKSPILVKDVLAKIFGGDSVNFGIGLSSTKEAKNPENNHNLPFDYELEIGKVYYVLPCYVNANNNDQSSFGVKRVKIVITKEQLRELLTNKQISIEQLVLGLENMKNKKKYNKKNRVSCSISTKTRLDSIPEEIE